MNQQAAILTIIEELQPDKFFAMPLSRQVADLRWALVRVLEMLEEMESE